MKKLLVILVIGIAVAGALYVFFPVAMTTYGGMGLNFVKSLSSPAGTLAVETNPAYKAPAAATSSPALADAAWPSAAPGDWPSYNRTRRSQRFSPLDQINSKNVGNLKVQCTYDLGIFTAFESGLIMVNNALIGTAEFEIFSINAATCAENWRTPPGLSRGAAASQPRRGLHGWHAVSRNTGLSCAGLRFQDRQTGVADDDLRHETWRVGAVGADCLGWPRLRRQCRRRLQGRQGS